MLRWAESLLVVQPMYCQKRAIQGIMARKWSGAFKAEWIEENVRVLLACGSSVDGVVVGDEG